MPIGEVHDVPDDQPAEDGGLTELASGDDDEIERAGHERLDDSYLCFMWQDWGAIGASEEGGDKDYRVIKSLIGEAIVLFGSHVFYLLDVLLTVRGWRTAGEATVHLLKAGDELIASRNRQVKITVRAKVANTVFS